MNIYIIDIDGTIADNSHREHLAKAKRWSEFFDLAHLDSPIGHMRRLLVDLAAYDADTGEATNAIVYVSGRSSRIKAMTLEWLLRHAFPTPDALFMREESDHRPDHVIKVELLERVRAEFGEPTMAFDDRNSVVRMWRELGVPCMHVTDKGDF